MSYSQSSSSPIHTHTYSDAFSFDDPQSSNVTPEVESSQQLHYQWDSLGLIKGHNVLRWTASKAELFNDWWHQQSWYKEQPNLFLSTDKQINWGSTARTSNVWRDFDQGARKSTGEPVVVCQKCSSILSHPSVKGAGTSTMSSHLKTGRCLRKSAHHSTLHQSQLRFSESTPVSMVTILITIKYA